METKPTDEAIAVPDSQRVLEIVLDLEKIRAAEPECVARLRDACAAYLNSSASEEELIERATYVYWEVPDAPVSLLANALLGDPKKTHAVAQLLPRQERAATCSECGNAFTAKVRSRSEAAVAKSKRRSAWFSFCEQCESGRQASRERDREQQREQELARQARVAHLATMPYKEYLQTPEWMETRMAKLRQARFKCQLCNAGGLLDTHHRTYARRGHEAMADLIVLCRDCHGKFHGKL
jgi:5-methylcytosine-specific restriction endonuclease McrA